MALGADRWQRGQDGAAPRFLAGRDWAGTGYSGGDRGRWMMTNQLFGVKPWDPVMLMFATLLLALAAVLASVIPARRAAGVEPMVALRNE